MIMFNSRIKNINEANEKALMPSGVVIDVQKIFALLHAKAVMEANKIGASAKPAIIIENTAAEGNDPKSAVFHSAGEHMIMARAANEGDKINKDSAFQTIQKYVEVFLGPDISKDLKSDECLPLLNGEGGNAENETPEKNTDGATAADDNEDEEVDESKIFQLSFTKYLIESKFLIEADEASEDEEGEDAEEDENDEEADDDGEGEAAEEGNEGEEAGDDGNDEEAGDDGNGEDGSADDDADKDPKNITEADGFYVLYGLKIAGLKETTVADAMKKWGSNVIKSFGIRFGNGFGGGMGDVHTIGGLVDNIKDALGRIKDPDQFARTVQDKLEKKYPSVQVGSVSIRDKKTLLADLDKEQHENYDGKAKQKISAADYSLVIQVTEKDPDKPFINRKNLANLVTMSLPGLSPKLKNLVTADSIIYLKGGGLKGSTYDYSSRSSDAGSIISPSQLRVIFKKNVGNDSDEIISQIEGKFQSIKKSKSIKNQEGKDAITKLWDKYSTQWEKELQDDSETEIDFSAFQKEYSEIYSKFFKKDESLKIISIDLMKQLFENISFNNLLDEEDEETEPDETEDDGSNEEEPADSENTGEEDQEVSDSTPYDSQDGDDIYVIPMKGIKMEDNN